MRDKRNHRSYDDSSLNTNGIDITGKKDMLFVKNKWQNKLDIAFEDIRKKVWVIEKSREVIVRSKNDAEKLKKDIEKHIEEKDRALSIIENLLKKELEYEDGMLGKTLDGMKSNGNVTIKQKLKDVEIDTLQYGSVEQYKRLYPKFGEEVFKIKKEMEIKDREIREAQERFHSEISNYNSNLENIDIDIQKATDNFEQYDDLLKDAQDELKSCRFYNSMLYKLSSKKTQSLLNLDTTIHDIRKFRNALNTVSKSISGLVPIVN